MASKRKRARRDHRAASLKGWRTRIAMAMARNVSQVSRPPLNLKGPREKLWRAVIAELGGAA